MQHPILPRQQCDHCPRRTGFGGHVAVFEGDVRECGEQHAQLWMASRRSGQNRPRTSRKPDRGHPEEIVFTSGATEADNLALKGVAEAYASKGDHIVTVATEHKAVLDTCKWLEKTGRRVTYIGVDGDGLIDLSELEAAITPQTVLVSVMMANNETGVLQPMAAISEIVHRKGCLLMSDATQAVGKVNVDVNALGIDLLAMSAHKLHGPKGVGALYVRRRNPRVALAAQMHGGGHERAMRSGTLNVPAIVGFGKACAIAQTELVPNHYHLAALREYFEAAILKIPGTKRNGHETERLVNTLNVSFEGVEAEALINAMPGIAISTGSACTSALMEPSHVLKAMGVADQAAYASIRFSWGRFTTMEEMELAVAEVEKGVGKLRGKQTPH
jgi:cysteine desulfurase